MRKIYVDVTDEPWDEDAEKEMMDKGWQPLGEQAREDNRVVLVMGRAT